MQYIPSKTPVLRSIKILPGQTIVLPKGIDIKSIISEGDATITSTCIIPNVTPLECYGFISFADRDQGSHTQELQIYGGDSGVNIHYEGVLINGIRINFATPISWFDNSGLKTALSAVSPLITNVFVSNQFTATNYGYKKYIMIRTVPVIGDNIQLIAVTSITVQTTSTGNVEYLLPAYKTAALIAAGNDSVPDCTL